MSPSSSGHSQLIPAMAGGQARATPRRSVFLRLIRVFVSSPQDVRDLRGLVEHELAEMQASGPLGRRFSIQGCFWERDVPRVVGPAPQETIEEFLPRPGEAEIFVMLMGGRLGSPMADPRTGRRYSSGTECELVQAHEAWKASGHRRPRILIYRWMKAPEALSTAAERAVVADFFSRFKGPKADFRGLEPQEFDEPAQLEHWLRRDLNQVIRAFDRRETWTRRGWTAALALGCVFATWFLTDQWARRDVEGRVDQVVATALRDGELAADAAAIWKPVAGELVALGPRGFPRIFAWLGRPAINQAKQGDAPAALMNALVGLAREGQPACEQFLGLLSPRGSAITYSKGIHRAVLTDGLPPLSCADTRRTVCDYVGRIKRQDFLGNPDDLSDLVRAAGRLIGTDAVRVCMTPPAATGVAVERAK
jgi:hypothetical protein